MTPQPWSTSNQDVAPVSWNAERRTFSIVLHGLTDLAGKEMLEAEWSPPVTYVIRIRELNRTDWFCAFETPLTSCGFADLKPNTEYEVEVRSKNDLGTSPPVTARVRTASDGTVNI